MVPLLLYKTFCLIHIRLCGNFFHYSAHTDNLEQMPVAGVHCEGSSLPIGKNNAVSKEHEF